MGGLGRRGKSADVPCQSGSKLFILKLFRLRMCTLPWFYGQCPWFGFVRGMRRLLLEGFAALSAVIAGLVVPSRSERNDLACDRRCER
jgi:hypothetical protein